MNKNLKTLASASAFAVFMFIAYGSEDQKESSSAINNSSDSIIAHSGEDQKESSSVINGSSDSLAVTSKGDKIDSLRNAERIKAEKMLQSFVKKEDDFEGISFYRDKRTPKYADVNFIYPYIGSKENSYWLRLKFQYASDSWLFINSAILMIDGKKYNINGNWERDHDSDIWEWLDISVEDNEYIILHKLANSKSAKVRYEGRQYHYDRVITQKEKDIIKKTLEIYDALK